jgi:ATP-dependent DNA helicase RecQ
MHKNRPQRANPSRSIQKIQRISVSKNNFHRNRLLEAVAERHTISVKMLTYLYEGDFTSEDRWNLLEDYFLGVISEKVKNDCKKKDRI